MDSNSEKDEQKALEQPLCQAQLSKTVSGKYTKSEKEHKTRLERKVREKLKFSSVQKRSWEIKLS